MAALLRQSDTLKSVVLHKNGIGDAGAVALASVLESNPTVETVGLNKNAVGNTGATALAAALATPTSAVAALKLEDNRIGDEGVLALAEILARPESPLKTLRLSGNKFGGVAAAAVLKVKLSKPGVDVSAAITTETEVDVNPNLEFPVPTLQAEQVARLEASIRASTTDFAFVKFDTAGCDVCKQLDPYWGTLAASLPGHLWRISCETEPKLCRDRDVWRAGEPVFEAWLADELRSGVVGVERFSSDNRGTVALNEFFHRKVAEARARVGSSASSALSISGTGEL